jgi:hypothetical protein
MLHPSPTAVDYIWEAFSDCYFRSETIALWKEIHGIHMAMNHRFLSDSHEGRKEFADGMLQRISRISEKNHEINLGPEKSYFIEMLSR